MLIKYIDSFSKRYTQELLFILLIFTIVFSSLKFQNGLGSNGNVEHWVNMINRMFYGKQDFLFSYGPLFWLAADMNGTYVAPYNIYVYWITILFLSVLYTFFWSTLFALSHGARSHLLFASAYFLFFSSLVFPSAFFLWSFAVVAYFDCSKDSPLPIRKITVIILGILAAFSLYIRIFYGMVAIATIGSYLFSRTLKDKTISQLALFVCSVALSYIVFGLIIFHDKYSLLNYLLINNQLNFGNSVDMTLDVKSDSSIFIAIFSIGILFNIYLVLKKWPLFLTVNGLLLIFFKIGFSRTDHYLNYFVTPVAILALIMIFDRNKLGRRLFVLIMVCLFYISVKPAYPEAQTRNPLRPPISFNKDYASRMQAIYSEFKLGDDILRIVGHATIDVYPYNNEYIFANKLNYLHRPSFQNYMTLTPQLDAMNRKFFESKERPKFILWTGGIGCVASDCNTFNGFDQKFALNEDPQTSSSIFLNYHVVLISKGKAGLPIMLLQENNRYVTYSDQLLSEVIMQFGKWYKVPSTNNGVIKLVPDFKFTAYGRVKNTLFRGNVLKIKYKTFAGDIKEYRLNILNAKSGIWVSPLLDNFELNGQEIESVMFEIDSSRYFESTFKSEWRKADIPGIQIKKSGV